MRKISRRSVIATTTSLLAAGCLSSPTDPSNQLVITDVSSVRTVEFDGTKSAHGYVKFTENTQNDTVTIEQSIKIPGNPCQSVNMDVRPDSGSTNNNPINVAVSLSGSGPDVACPSVLPGNYPAPSAITINFESLSSGQTITVSFGDESDVSVSYTTIGENNTATREPFNVPAGVRVG